MASPPQPTHEWTGGRAPRVRRLSSCDLTSDPFAPWCCELKETGPGRTGSGVIVELPDLEQGGEYLRTHFPGLRKINITDKICTKYALITCHHTIPGVGYIQGWSVSFGSGKRPIRLDSLVVGAVSCCGDDSIIAPLPPETTGTLKEHPSEYCELKLDFTIFFLNANIKSIVSSSYLSSRKSWPGPPQLTPQNLPDLKAILNMEGGSQASPTVGAYTVPGKSATLSSDDDDDVTFHLYHRYHDQQDGSMVSPIPIQIEKCKDALLLQPKRLRHQVEVHEKFQKIFYHSQVGIKMGYSGSPIVYSSSGGAPQLIGIHVGVNEDNDGYESSYIAVSVYGILQLLQGQLPACFSLMRHAQPRRVWPSRWAHLIQCQFANQKVRMDLGYLVEILDLLLEKHMGIQLIAPRISDPPNETIAALDLLSTVFKRFENSGHGDIAAAIDGVTVEDEKGCVEGVLGANQRVAFIANIRDLCRSMLDLLTNVESDRDRMEQGNVRACFHCWNMMLNFKYKRLVGDMLQRGDSLAHLGRLRAKYSDCTEILADFADIHVKCRLFLSSQHEEELQWQRSAMEELKFKHAQQEMELKGEIQRIQQNVAQLDKEKGDAVAMCQQREKETTRMSETLAELEGEQKQLLHRVHTLQGEKGKAEDAYQQKDAESRRMHEESERVETEKTNLETVNRRLSLSSNDQGVEIQQLRQNIQTLQVEKHTAESTAQQHRQRTASLRSKTEQLKRQLAVAADEKKALEGRLESERTVADYRAKQLEGSMRIQTKDLKESRQSIMSLSQQLQAQKAKIESLENEIRELRHENQEVKKKAEKTQHQLERSQSGETHTLLLEADVEVKDLELQQEGLKRKLKAADNELESTKKELADSKKELADSKKEFEKELADSKKELEEVRKELETTRRELMKQREEK